MAILLAIGSLLCAAANDVVFRAYALRSRATGGFMACVGVIWAAAFAAASIPGGVAGWTWTSVSWGITSGLLSASANVLLIEGMARSPAGICATVYRLNLAPAAVLAILLFDEAVSAGRLGGLACAMVAVLLFSIPGPARLGRLAGGGVSLCVIAALLRAGMGIAYKAGLSGGASSPVMLSVNGCCWIAAGVAYQALSRRALPPGRMLGAYSVASGTLICGIVGFMAAALRVGDASVVLPVAQLSFLGTALIGRVALDERLSRRQVSGLAVAVLCILLFALG